MNEIPKATSFKLSSVIREKLLDVGIMKTFEPGSTILRFNAYINSIPIVFKGSIRVMRADDEGKEMLLYYINPGESCIMSFLAGMHLDTSKVKAIAEETTEVLFVPMDKVNLFIKEFPEWLDYIFKLYHKRFEELLSVVNEVAFKKLDERLLSFLQKKSEQNGDVNILISHEQLANELGTARVVVSRLLKQMENQGLVELGRNKIKLV